MESSSLYFAEGVTKWDSHQKIQFYCHIRTQSHGPKKKKKDRRKTGKKKKKINGINKVTKNN